MDVSIITLRLTSSLLFALLFVAGVNSSFMLLLWVFVKCNSERDCPGSGGPLTACDMSNVGLVSEINHFDVKFGISNFEI